MRVLRLALMALLISVPAWAQAPELQWGPAPPFFPAGARFTVVQGDPSANGIYTVRLDMPSGYVIAPHFHPTDEHITVISGRFLVGMGDSADFSHPVTLNAGGFITAGANMHHFARAQGRTVVQVHGQGPFSITYVKAGDDPRNHGTH